MEAELVKTLAIGSIVYTRWPVCTPDGEIIARETVGMVADIDGVTVRVSFGDDVEAAVHELALVEMDAPQGLPRDGGLGDTLPELALRLLETNQQMKGERSDALTWVDTLADALAEICSEPYPNRFDFALGRHNWMELVSEVRDWRGKMDKANGHQSH